MINSRHELQGEPNLVPNLVRFGVFELDLRARELRKNGLGTGLPEQSIKILALLTDKPGDVVLREEIRRKLWPNDTVVEFDHSINAAIKRLRQALDDSAENPEYIETLHRRGYRWIQPVERDAAASHLAAPVIPEGGTPDTHNLIGRKVSHYRVLELLGGGGMGVVYKAEDLKLGRRVALKFLPEELVSDPAALQRFESEARAASALNHPNIFTIYEVEEYAGQPFIVMELLDGQTLRDLIATSARPNSPFEFAKLRSIAIQISAGLEAAHQQSIIHRDIKPANIFVTSQGQAKILDFGLAKFSITETAPTISSTNHHDENGSRPQSNHQQDSLTASSPFLSRTGVAMGTAGYMSPEQIRGEKLDARTDLFSFGLVLYEMATGQRPFRGETPATLQNSILNHTFPSLQELNPEFPAELAAIIAKALERNLEKRYQHAAEIRADLEGFNRGAEPATRSGRWRGLSLAATALFAIALIFWFSKSGLTTKEHAFPEPNLRPLTTNSFENRVTSGGISPDGKYLAYTDTKGLYVKLIDTGATRAVFAPEELKGQNGGWQWAAWLTDSSAVVANAHRSGVDPDRWDSQESSVWLVPAAGGPPHKLRDRAVAYSVSPNGSSISFGANKGNLGDREIWLMGRDGENPHKFLDTDEQSSIKGLSWSPDGTRVLYHKTDQSGDTLLSRDLQNGPSSALFGPTEMRKLNDLLWLADGRLLYSVAELDSFAGSACNFWEMRLDGRTGKPIEKPRQLTNWSGFCMSALSETSNGKNLAFLKWAGKETSFIADLTDGGTHIRNHRHFPLSESSDGAAGWTPDSKAIIFNSNRSGHTEIYRQFLDHDIAEPVVTKGYGRNPQVTPDGKNLLYLGPTENGVPITKGPQAVVLVPLIGGTPLRLFTARANSIITCGRSASAQCVIGEPTDDEKELIVTTIDPTTGRGRELFRFPLIANEENWFLDMSPDGTRFAVTQTPVGPIYILSLCGKEQTQFGVKGWTSLESFFWAADGNGLFVTAGVRNGKDILCVDLQGNAHLLWENSGGSGETEARPSPDGRHLAFSSWTTSGNIWLMENF